MDGLRVAIAAACLAGAAAGCRSMLEVPQSAKASGRTSEEAPDGWLFNRLTGRKPEAASDSSRAGRDVSSGVRLASHTSTEAAAGAAGLASPSRASDFKTEDDQDDGLTLSDFYPSNIGMTVKKLTGNGPNEAVARALYQEGDALYREGRYKEAAEKFERAAERAPESPLQEDCLFMQGESLFFSDQYPKANDVYAKLLKRYTYTRYLDKVAARQFAIGRYWEQINAADPAWFFSLQLTDPTRPKLDTFGYALKAYESVRMNDPTGPLADDSIMATADAYFLKGRYEEAAYHYDLIRKEYPKSEHQLNAHVLGMKSKLETYQGPAYDGSPLEDAAEIAEETTRQFGTELGSERERVVETQNAIREKQADRDWFLAQYFEKKKDYRGARYYYQVILDEYPATACAERARARLAEIRDLPDKPANHFQWLTDVFPSTTD
jgi:outer membrane protein assembly factor BamD (BamD/ComL family)